MRSKIATRPASPPCRRRCWRNEAKRGSARVDDSRQSAALEVAPRMREPHDSEAGRRPVFAAGKSLLKKEKSRASRLAKPDARHRGTPTCRGDPAHKPASSVDAVRVPHGRCVSTGAFCMRRAELVRRGSCGDAGDGVRAQQERSVEVAKPHRKGDRRTCCSFFPQQV